MKDIYNSEICKILYLQRLWFYDILLIKKWYFIIFIYFLLFSKKSIDVIIIVKWIKRYRILQVRIEETTNLLVKKERTLKFQNYRYE